MEKVKKAGERADMHDQLAQRTCQAEAVMEQYLPDETGHQRTIFEAMNYSVRAGGKRLRPILMQETYRLFGGSGKEIEPFMAAVEMIHTSSLIHDDLPCMDNDELRRGKPTTWVKYGYDMAVLAGDALLIYAVETAAKACSMTENGGMVARAIGLMAEKTGIYGMIGGQVVDVELTNQPVPREKLDFIYRLKTGALLEASMMIGALLGGADEAALSTVERIASLVGVAFQIQDDILDVTATTFTSSSRRESISGRLDPNADYQRKIEEWVVYAVGADKGTAGYKGFKRRGVKRVS